VSRKSINMGNFSLFNVWAPNFPEGYSDKGTAFHAEVSDDSRYEGITDVASILIGFRDGLISNSRY